MNPIVFNRHVISNFLVAISFCCFANQLLGQSSRESETLVVTGQVKAVYRQVSGTRDHLIQLRVRDLKANPRRRMQQSEKAPVSGEYIYVHVSGPSTGLVRDSKMNIPEPNQMIRARVVAGSDQSWNSVAGQWFEEVNSSPADGAKVLGVKTEMAFVDGQRRLKVTEVELGSPAKEIGIEAGDILIKANGVGITNSEELATQIQRSRGTLKLLVRNFRTGENVPIEVKLKSNIQPGIKRSVGLETELAFYDGVKALKIVGVKENSPASEIGFQAGLLILKVNGKTIEKVEDLSEAEKTSQGEVVLDVVNTDSKKQQRVKVKTR